MEIKQLKLIFENCETITIDRKYIGALDIDNIKKSISRNACNSISSNLSCDSFVISINRKLPIEKLSSWTIGDVLEERNPLIRIQQYNDITGIEVIYENDTSEYIFIQWGGDSDYSNEYQKVYVNDFEDVFIVIDKDNDLDYYFDMEEINNKDNINFMWSMYEEE